MSNSTDSIFNPTQILLPIDFSSSSLAALEAAAGVARQFQAKIYLVHVIPEFPDFNGSDFFPFTSALQERKSEVERKLMEYETLLKQQGVDSAFRIEIGNDIVGNLLLVIQREHLDMVIISTHGLSGWRPMIFGSIAEKVIKLVQCPLLLLHSPQLKATPREPSLQIWEDTFQEAGVTQGLPSSKPAEASVLTASERTRVNVDALEMSERAKKTEQRYAEAHSIFTK